MMRRGGVMQNMARLEYMEKSMILYQDMRVLGLVELLALSSCCLVAVVLF